MDSSLQPLSAALDQAECRVRAGSDASSRIWPTGFDLLDAHLSGGFRSGELILLGGPQGLGKTTWALQVARNVVRSGRAAVMFSFEHDAQTLLVRLVALEAGEIDEFDAPSVNRIREAFEATDARGTSLADRLEDTVGGVQALEAVHGYADRLMLHRSLGSSTTLQTIRIVVEQVREHTGQRPLVVVDYLQKVKVPNGSPEEAERTTDIVEGLKDMALDFDLPVLAVVAADKEGLETGRRMRVANLRGSSALAYEADTVLLVNDKYDVVARQHLIYNVAHADRFHDWVVMSVEKNRAGRDGVTLELHKRFDQSRFDGDGRRVMEHLVDERVFTE